MLFRNFPIFFLNIGIVPRLFSFFIPHLHKHGKGLQRRFKLKQWHKILFGMMPDLRNMLKHATKNLHFATKQPP